MLYIGAQLMLKDEHSITEHIGQCKKAITTNYFNY